MPTPESSAAYTFDRLPRGEWAVEIQADDRRLLGLRWDGTWEIEPEDAPEAARLFAELVVERLGSSGVLTPGGEHRRANDEGAGARTPASSSRTRDEFERGYAERSGMTVEELRDLGQVVVRCYCGEDGCEGWAMVSREAAKDYEPGGIYGPR